MDSQLNAQRAMDLTCIPDRLRVFVPTVSRVAFKAQADQDRFASWLSKHQPKEALAIERQGETMRSLVAEWNVQLTHDTPAGMAKLADQPEHPFWAFSDALSVIDLLDTGQTLTPEAQARSRREALQIKFGDVADQAEEAFRNRDYAKFIRLIEPFEEILQKGHVAKLKIARSRI